MVSMLHDDALPLSYSQISFCGPWILPDGTLSTHTSTQVGLLNNTWMTQTRLNYLGANNLIAHIKIRKLHIALGKEIHVMERPTGESSCSASMQSECVTVLWSNAQMQILWTRRCNPAVEMFLYFLS